MEVARSVIAPALVPGCRAVDATVGNGHDTLFLAELVGPDGRVYGFDVQPQALSAARARLEAAGLAGRVRLIEAGHERLAEFVAPGGPISAAMFNLGYLPGGDPGRITRPETTLAAIDAALALLAPGGVVTVVAYPGHVGGESEARAMTDRLGSLDEGRWECARYEILRTRTPAPVLLAIARR